MVSEIIIPVFNEAHRLDLAVGLFAKQFKSSAVRFWWVDDGSTDGSFAVLKKLLAENFSSVEHQLIRCERNQGKGAAVRHVIALLKKQIRADAVVAFWDSDGELEPQALSEALQIVASRQADVVFCSRFMKETPRAFGAYPFLGNLVLTAISNWFSGLSLSDVHCCGKILRAGILFQLPLQSMGFDFEAELTAMIGKVRSPVLKLKEIPVGYTPRTKSQGKKIGFRHVWPQVYQAIRCRYSQETLHLRSHFIPT